MELQTHDHQQLVLKILSDRFETSLHAIETLDEDHLSQLNEFKAQLEPLESFYRNLYPWIFEANDSSIMVKIGEDLHLEKAISYKINVIKGFDEDNNGRQLSDGVASEGKVELESEDKGEGKDEDKGESKGEAKGEGKGEAKGESKGEAKGESKREGKGEGKVKVKGEGKAKVKGEGKVDVKGDGKKETKGKGGGGEGQVEDNECEVDKVVTRIRSRTKLDKLTNDIMNDHVVTRNRTKTTLNNEKKQDFNVNEALKKDTSKRNILNLKKAEEEEKDEEEKKESKYIINNIENKEIHHNIIKEKVNGIKPIIKENSSSKAIIEEKKIDLGKNVKDNGIVSNKDKEHPKTTEKPSQNKPDKPSSAKPTPKPTDKKDEHKKDEPKKDEPKKPELKKEEPKKPEPKKEESKKPELKKEETKKPEPKKEESQKPELKKEETKKPEPKKEETKKPESKKEEPKKLDPNKEESKKPEPKKEEPKKPEPNKEESKKPESKKEEPKKLEPNKEELKKPELKKEETKKPEPKKEEPKKPEPKKEESKKPEPKKEEPKKTEPKKEESKKPENHAIRPTGKKHIDDKASKKPVKDSTKKDNNTHEVKPLASRVTEDKDQIKLDNPNADSQLIEIEDLIEEKKNPFEGLDEEERKIFEGLIEVVGNTSNVMKKVKEKKEIEGYVKKMIEICERKTKGFENEMEELKKTLNNNTTNILQTTQFSFKSATKDIINLCEKEWISQFFKKSNFIDEVIAILHIFLIINPDIHQQGQEQRHEGQRQGQEQTEYSRKRIINETKSFFKDKIDNIGEILMNIQGRVDNIPINKRLIIKKILKKKPTLFELNIYDSDPFCMVLSILMNEICEYLGVIASFPAKKVNNNDKICYFDELAAQFYKERHDALCKFKKKFNIGIEE